MCIFGGAARNGLSTNQQSTLNPRSKKEIMDKMAEQDQTSARIGQRTLLGFKSFFLGFVYWIDWFFTMSEEELVQAGINLDGEGRNNGLEILDSAKSEEDQSR